MLPMSGFADTGERLRKPLNRLSAVVTESRIKPKTAVEVRCHAPDLELLFVDWLNRIIYEMAVRQMLFGRYAVKLNGVTSLTGVAVGRAAGCRATCPGLRA